jgi:tRNA (adenine57-N1/adenine58-N1)-methyltransferase
MYPADINLLVSPLGLLPDVYDAGRAGDGKLEVLEAGTEHGSLTTHLSRAIHAGNPPTPKPAPEEDVETTDARLVEWKERRQAILHTIDVASQYSAHARQTIAAFRHSQYLHNIDFHTGSVSDWVASALAARNDEPFLSHAFLDLPNADTHIENVAKAVEVDGTLIVFNPSITQINEYALKIKQLSSLKFQLLKRWGMSPKPSPTVSRSSLRSSAYLGQESRTAESLPPQLTRR